MPRAKPKNWDTHPIGLFYTDEPWRVEEILDVTVGAWMTRAACLGTSTEAWFVTPRPTEAARLATICASCPVRPQCLDHALRHEERGWWGGLSERARRQIYPKSKAS